MFVILLVFLNFFQAHSAPDYSLTESEYKSLGIPSVTKKWDTVDYYKAVQILQTLKAKNSMGLPQAESKKSAVLFLKLNDVVSILDKYNQNSDKSFNVNVVTSYAKIYLRLLTLYLQPKSSKQFYDTELVDLFITGIKAADRQVDILKRLKETEQNKKSFDIFNHGYARFLFGLIEQLGNPQQYSTQNLERLGEKLKAELGLNKRILTVENNKKITLLLSRVEQGPVSSIIKSDCSEMIHTLAH